MDNLVIFDKYHLSVKDPDLTKQEKIKVNNVLKSPKLPWPISAHRILNEILNFPGMGKKTKKFKKNLK